MTTIQIPDTIDAAIAELGGLGALLTAKGWQRAAIIYAFTCEDGQGSRSDLTCTKVDKLNCRAFAALGIHGLTSQMTVYRHRRNWQTAIDDGLATPTGPGQMVTLPTTDYPENARGNDTRLDDKLRPDAAPETKAEAILAVMARDPEAKKRVQDAFVQETGTDHTLAGRVFRTYAEHNVRPAPRKSEPMLLTSMGFGSVVYSRVKDLVPRLGEYVEALSAVTIDDEVSACVQEDIDDLDKTKGLIEEFSDKLRQAIGTDADTVAQRLLR